MHISYDKLEPAILRSILEDFVSRDGTDYGEREYSVDEKVEQVRLLLEAGKATISFNPEDETCTIVTL